MQLMKCKTVMMSKTKKMKKVKLLILWLFFSGLIYSQTVYITNYKYEADYKVYFTNTKAYADRVVNITEYKYKAKKSNKYWYFVKSKYQADIKIYIVNHKSDANLIVYIKGN